MKLIKKELQQLITNGTAILIGSRGLGVNTELSDTDIAMLWSNLPTSLQTAPIADIRKYFNFLPLHNSGLIKLDGIDILLFDNQQDMDIINKAKEDLLKIPKYFLENKQTRIQLFEESLNHYGWYTNYPRTPF